MEFFSQLAEFTLHIDDHLKQITDNYHQWVYLILFVIIFIETGLVVAPFLPGDSLLFAAGALAALGSLDLLGMIGLLIAAAILGDSTNYAIGKFIGPKVFYKEDSLFLKKKYLDDTRRFYEKYGNKTIVLARFIPIIRTFAPFVAGIGQMNYRLFLFYNALGGILWVSLCVFCGYFLGNIPIIKNNFSIAILVIIFLSILPIIFEVRNHHGRNKVQA